MVRSLAAAGKLGNDVLSTIVSRTDSPSYGFQLEQGATTLAESWEAKYGMSWNHAVDGHIDDWFYTHIAGLRAGTETRHYPKAPPADTTPQPHVLVPRPVEGLTYAEASRRVSTGTLRLRWSIGALGRVFVVEVAIPPGTTAHLALPVADLSQVHEGGRPCDEHGTEAMRLIRSEVNGLEGVLLHVTPGAYRFDMPHIE